MSYVVLIADDDPAIRQAVRLCLSGPNYKVVESESLEKTYDHIKSGSIDVLLLDIHFGEHTSISLLEKLQAEDLYVPTVCVSGAASASEAATIMKLGVYDYIDKPIAADRLKIVLKRCLEFYETSKQLELLSSGRGTKSDLVGDSSAMAALDRQIKLFAPKDVKVLITGETGVGKDVVAHGIWRNSERSEKPFVVVNAAAVPENLLESELFGHKKGAFTGATSNQSGKIELAHGGSLFLDEIGDLSISAQTKLLRFIETGEIQKVGENQVRRVNVRLIAATSRDLKLSMEKGTFREDLYYRLNVAEIHVPPLREHKDDLKSLFIHFVGGFAKKLDTSFPEIEPEVFTELRAHSWPGNVRELRNIAERLVLIGQGVIRGSVVRLQLGVEQAGQSDAGPKPFSEILPLKDFKNKMELEYLDFVIGKSDGSITEAARVLHIDRSYLHQKLAKLKKATGCATSPG